MLICFIVNNNEPLRSGVFTIQLKLEAIAWAPGSKARVFAIFDSCRTHIDAAIKKDKYMPLELERTEEELLQEQQENEIVSGRGYETGTEEEKQDPMRFVEHVRNQFFYLTSANPGSKAHKD